MPFRSFRKHLGRPLTLALLFVSMLLEQADAQGQPVETGSHVPVWLWVIGVGILGIALAYGIIRNSKRSASEKATTERATKDLYANEDRKERM